MIAEAEDGRDRYIFLTSLVRVLCRCDGSFNEVLSADDFLDDLASLRNPPNTKRIRFEIDCVMIREL